jgi:hypothetical protein
MLPKITGIAAFYGFSRFRFFLFLACVFENIQVNFIGYRMFTARTIMVSGIIVGFLPFGACHYIAP